MNEQRILGFRGGRGDNRQTRRMLEKMGVNLEEIPDVEEVVIRTATKELIIKKANVSQLKGKGGNIYQVMGDNVEEVTREKPKYKADDILLVAQQANVSSERAIVALEESGGDLAQAILKLTA